jgi:hypothetical protein
MSVCQLWLMSDTAHYRFNFTFRGANLWHGILIRH